MSSEGLKTRDHVSLEALRINKGVEQVYQKVDFLVAQEDTQTRERFLQSLRYPDFNQRRNQVDDAHNGSLKWIFDGHELDDSDGSEAGSFNIKWDSFSKWLSSTDSVYWISGKPGSGKTTVVKYILDHEQTKQNLNVWSPGCLIASHYFWRPGSRMQKNLEGLFCSLLYQLLGANSAALGTVMSVSGEKNSYTDWSSAELRSAFLTALDSCPNGVCLFLDGLDEIDPEDGTKSGIPEFLDLASEVSQRSNVKLCLASRPDPYILHMRLSTYPRLQLQDLNYKDLFAYAKDHVKCPDIDISDNHYDPIKSLVHKAEGVFMWLILATKSVNEGTMYHDSTELLRERINRLPKDLDDLYQDMWARAGADSPEEYRQMAALYFKLLLLETRGHYLRLNIFDLMLATTPISDRVLDNLNKGPNLVSQDLILKTWQEVERKLRVYTVGLVVEPAPKSETEMGRLPPMHEELYGRMYERVLPLARRSPLTFIHRTAYDFLSDTDSGHKILTYDTSSEFSIKIRFMRLWFANVALYPDEHRLKGGWADELREFREAWKGTNEWVSTEWTRLLCICEKLANANRLFGEPVFSDPDWAISLVGGDFLVFLICKDVDEEFVISRLKDGNLNINEKSAILMSLSNLSGSIRQGSGPRSSKNWRHPRPRTFFDLMAAGAEVNWQAPEGSNSHVWSGTGPDYIQTPWQRYLVRLVEDLSYGQNCLWKDHAGAQKQLADMAEVLVLFISNGAQLDDMVNFMVRHSESSIEWVEMNAREARVKETGLLASIPAYTVVTILTEVLSHRLTQSDGGFIPESCISLRRACVDHRSSKTCRVIGKVTRYKGWLDLWESTDEMQSQFGSMVVEVLKRQLARTAPVIRADYAPSKTRASDVEKTIKSIIDDASWTMKLRGPFNIITHLEKLGLVAVSVYTEAGRQKINCVPRLDLSRILTPSRQLRATAATSLAMGTALKSTTHEAPTPEIGISWPRNGKTST